MTEHSTLEPGTLVVCTTRLPPKYQPWSHEIYVGIVDEPTDTLLAYNKLIREQYPTHREKINVLYPFGLVGDLVGTLIPITPDEAKLSFRAKIKRFMGPVSLAYYDQARCQLRLPEEERT